MSKYDELLARADASHHILSRELGAAIRELRDAVLTEGRAREEHTQPCCQDYEHCNRACTPRGIWLEQNRPGQFLAGGVAGQDETALEKVTPTQNDFHKWSTRTIKAPASPLLPGLERAAEIEALEAEIHRIDYERMKMADALRKILDYPLDSDVINAAAQMKFIAVRAFTSPIAAEISRLKGEGS